MEVDSSNMHAHFRTDRDCKTVHLSYLKILILVDKLLKSTMYSEQRRINKVVAGFGGCELAWKADNVCKGLVKKLPPVKYNMNKNTRVHKHTHSHTHSTTRARALVCVCVQTYSDVCVIFRFSFSYRLKLLMLKSFHFYYHS